MSTSVGQPPFPSARRRRRFTRARLVAAAVALLPVLELAVAISIGRVLGVTVTLLLLLAGTASGVVVLRRVGLAAVRRRSARAPGPDGVVVTPGGPVAGDEPPVAQALLVVAGLLLVVPGFVTDVAGLVLLAPPVRRALSRRMGAALLRRIRTLRGVTVVRGAVLRQDGEAVDVTIVQPDPPADPLIVEAPAEPRRPDPHGRS